MTDVVGKIQEWEAIYLKDAHKRLQKQLKGYELSIHDVANMVYPRPICCSTPMKRADMSVDGDLPV